MKARSRGGSQDKTLQSKNDYIEGTTLRLDLWGEQFATLAEKLASSKGTLRPRVVERLKTLRRQKRELKTRLRMAAHSVESSEWETTRTEIEVAVEHFRSSAGEFHDRAREV